MTNKMTDRERIVQLEQEIDRLTDYSNGLNHDLVAALELVQATRFAALEEAAKWHDSEAAIFQREHDRCMEHWRAENTNSNWVQRAVAAEQAHDRHKEYAAQLRALAHKRKETDE